MKAKPRADMATMLAEFDRLVYRMLCQVPKGMITTYGDIAKALGDPAAARAVGMAVASNPYPVVVPCHRVVYASGELGWYGGKGKGTERKRELLEEEGVGIVGGRVEGFERIRFTRFDVEPILRRLREEQERMRAKVVDRDDFGSLRNVAGIDVSYSGDRGFAALALFDWKKGEIVEKRAVAEEASFPYIPTYLSFRELPIVSDLIRERKDTVYMIDGHGILHPRGFGIASHIGVAFDVPAIGAAKSLLVGEVQETGKEVASILLEGEIKGYELRREGRKPLYVSVGHRVSLQTAVRICTRYLDADMADPLRTAHRLANDARRGAVREKAG